MRKIFKSIFCLLIVLNFSISYGQVLDSLHVKEDTYRKHIFFKRSILPISLIGVGLVLNKSELEQKWQKEIRNKVGNEYSFPIEDYAQYVPIIEMYAADALGVEAKNHWFDQTKQNIYYTENVQTLHGKLAPGEHAFL